MYKKSHFLFFTIGAVLIILTSIAVSMFSRGVGPTPNDPVTTFPVQKNIAGTYCFGRIQKATTDAPYAVEEHVSLTIADDGTISGTKSGTQAGSDMTNGYEGTLTGKLVWDTMELVYAYTVEGSQNKELEVYKFSPEVLIKSRWQLEESDHMLVPIRVGDPTLITYSSEICAK